MVEAKYYLPQTIARRANIVLVQTEFLAASKEE